MTLQKWTAGEIFFFANSEYENPFMDVELTVTFTNESGEKLVRPAFWCGENKWCVRFAPTELGVWTYLTTCSNRGDDGLHNIKGELTCVEYEGDLEIYKRGFIKISENNRYFTYVASFGAFTRVSYATPQNLKNALGHLAYVLGGIQELSQIRHIPMALELDGVPVEGEFLFGAVSNSTSVGGAPTLDAKGVDLRDGKFEVTLIRMPKNMAEVTECVQALLSQLYDCSAITFRRVSSLTVRQAPEVDWTLDGEHAPGAELIRIENQNRAIRLVHKWEET